MIKALLIGAMLYTSPSDSDKITNYEYKINEMIDNKVITLERDGISDNNDKYGRLLRYVYLNKKDVNLQMLKSGYAKPYLYFDFEKLKQYKYYD